MARTQTPRLDLLIWPSQPWKHPLALLRLPLPSTLLRLSPSFPASLAHNPGFPLLQNLRGKGISLPHPLGLPRKPHPFLSPVARLLWNLGLCQWKHNAGIMISPLIVISFMRTTLIISVWVLSLKNFWILLPGMILPIHYLLLMFLLCENFMPFFLVSAYWIWELASSIPSFVHMASWLLNFSLLFRGSFHRSIFSLHPLSFPGKKGENISKFLGILDMTLLIVTSSPYLLFHWCNVFSPCSAYRFAILLLDWTW